MRPSRSSLRKASTHLCAPQSPKCQRCPAPAFCAPPAPRARRPLPPASAHHLTRNCVRFTAAGIPTRRHGDVHIIYKLSDRAAATSSCNEHDQHDRAAGICRYIRARVHWPARCLPTRACRAFALLQLTAANLRACASHHRLSLPWPTPPPRRLGRPHRVRQLEPTAVVSAAAAAFASIAIESTALAVLSSSPSSASRSS